MPPLFQMVKRSDEEPFPENRVLGGGHQVPAKWFCPIVYAVAKSVLVGLTLWAGKVLLSLADRPDHRTPAVANVLAGVPQMC